MNRRILIVVAIAAYLLFVAGNFAYSFILMERNVNMAVGPLGTYSNAVGEKLNTWLTDNGVSTSLTVQEDTLSVIAEVNNAEDDIRDSKALNVGFVAQGVDADEYQNVVSLGSIASLPLLIFARAELGEDLDLADLAGAEVSAGVPGSDVNTLMMDIVSTYGFSSEIDVRSNPTTVGIEQLLNGEVDALALLDSIRTPFVEELALNPELTIVNLDRASALAFELGYAEPATIPPSFISLAKRIPSKPITTVAVELTVIANDYLDEPNVLLIAQQLSVLDPRMNLPSDQETYPNFVGTQFPASGIALDYYNSGVPLRYTVFPNSLISWVWVPLARVVTVTLLIWAALRFVIPFIWNSTTPTVITLRRLSYLEKKLLEGRPLTERQKHKLEQLVATIEGQSVDQNQKIRERALSLLGRTDHAAT